MLNKLTKLIPIFYKDLPSSIKGRSWGLWIEIDNKYKDDLGLLAHERVHCRQFFKTLGLHGILYSISKTYKYKAEIEAFGYSIYYKNRTKENVENSLRTYYGIPSDVMSNYDKDIEKSISNASRDFKELSS